MARRAPSTGSRSRGCVRPGPASSPSPSTAGRATPRRNVATPSVPAMAAPWGEPASPFAGVTVTTSWVPREWLRPGPLDGTIIQMPRTPLAAGRRDACGERLPCATPDHQRPACHRDGAAAPDAHVAGRADDARPDAIVRPVPAGSGTCRRAPGVTRGSRGGGSVRSPLTHPRRSHRASRSIAVRTIGVSGGRLL